jgi:hypothetical protein
MKRISFRKRVMVFPTPLVRPRINRQPNLPQTSSGSEKRRLPTRKIFVIKEAQRLPATNAASRTMRRVLIFDNHPDSLRLVFGRQADFAESNRTSISEFVLVATLTFGLAFGMFWPLFFQ